VESLTFLGLYYAEHPESSQGFSDVGNSAEFVLGRIGELSSVR